MISHSKPAANSGIKRPCSSQLDRCFPLRSGKRGGAGIVHRVTVVRLQRVISNSSSSSRRYTCTLSGQKPTEYSTHYKHIIYIRTRRWILSPLRDQQLISFSICYIQARSLVPYSSFSQALNELGKRKNSDACSSTRGTHALSLSLSPFSIDSDLNHNRSLPRRTPESCPAIRTPAYSVQKSNLKSATTTTALQLWLFFFLLHLLTVFVAIVDHAHLPTPFLLLRALLLCFLDDAHDSGQLFLSWSFRTGSNIKCMSSSPPPPTNQPGTSL